MHYQLHSVHRRLFIIPHASLWSSGSASLRDGVTVQKPGKVMLGARAACPHHAGEPPALPAFSRECEQLSYQIRLNSERNRQDARNARIRQREGETLFSLCLRVSVVKRNWPSEPGIIWIRLVDSYSRTVSRFRSILRWIS